jgi:RHS repeat-associated protein
MSASFGGEDIAVFNSATNSLAWHVKGEVKFPHHSTPDFSANNSNTGATSYTTDPYAIALTQTNSYLYPDMEYKLTDHLGSTRMMYKLNFTCAGVYQNATIQYLADYYSFGKIVREYINAGTAAEKYQYTGKERDTESGYDNFNARNYHSEVGRFLSVDPLAEKFPAWSPYCFVMNNPLRLVDPDGRAPKDIIVTSANGKTLFTLNDGKKAITKMTSEQLYARGIQWFEPTANNYMPLKSIDKSFSKSDRVLHFSWDNIASFAEEDRFMISYRPGGSGDWKADGKPGDGYRLVDVGGEPYWADAIGQIPFAVDKFTDELEATGSVAKARQATIETGQQFGDGIGLNSDTSNGYDNAMIRRAINWAAKRYKAVEGSGWFGDDYDLQKTNHSPSNLSKSSDEKQ